MVDAKETRQDDGPGNFIEDLIREEIAQGRVKVHTRFPPEPNGYLHIGHAKSIVLNHGLSSLLPDAKFNLRFDDTNPAAEETEFVDSIKEDVRWLGADWEDRLYFTSDYFQQLYDWAETLIQKGLAYVDSQSTADIRETRGDFHNPGTNSPYRERSVEENLDLFRRMRAGEFDEGAHVLRAKIDMTHKDLKLRDPLMYRIKKAAHHRTGDAWPIYPIYDWAHGQSDAIEGITHSICTLEFQNHRNLYNWFLEALEIENPPRQIEFARLSLTYTLLSKRNLQLLVNSGQVSGWDDPRMPTIAGMRRRGYSPESIRAFAKRVGVSKNNTLVDVTLLEHALREDLNATSPRRMAVLRPLKLVITNYPENKVEEFEVDNIPGVEEAGKRKVSFSKEVWVEQDDFKKEAPKKWWRLAPGNEVRLRGAALVTVTDFDEDADGNVTEVRCTYDEASPGGAASDGRKIKGTIHWVSAAHATSATVRLYDRLFKVEDTSTLDNYVDGINEHSLEVLEGCQLEASLTKVEALQRFQFERLGYFCVDKESTAEEKVFNRTIGLRDSWAKVAKKGK